MNASHHVVAILPYNDLEATQAFYERLGFTLRADHGYYRILADGRGWHLHLRSAEPGWVRPERNGAGIYLYADNVDAVAGRVRDLIIGSDRPKATDWGMYEFAVSDPDGVLVRVGREIG